MKARNVIIAFFILLAFVGCKKDDGYLTFSLKTANYQSQGKTHMEVANGVCYTCWNDGDQIKVNGSVATISGSDTTITVSTSTNGYYAIYPASCVSGTVGSSTTITLPSVYEYSEQNGNQVLNAPMAAKAVSNNNKNLLFFKNLCTLLKIHVVGSVTVHNINIHSSSTALSGTATVSINGPEQNNISMSSVTGKNHVSLHFPSGSYTGSDGKDYYIPVPALPVDDTLHIALVATINSNGSKRVYMRSTTTQKALPANLVIPMNVFPEHGRKYEVGACVTYLMGNRLTTDNGGYIRPYINTLVHANQGTTIEMSLSPANDDIPLETTYAPFIYGQNGSQGNPVMYYLWNAPVNSATTDIAQTGSKLVTPEANYLCATANLNDRYYISHTPNSFTISNINSNTNTTREYSHNGTPATYTSVDPIYLMGAAGDDGNRRFMGKCYYFRVSDGSGKVFDGIPVKVPYLSFNQFLSWNIAHGQTAASGDVPCMYDLVSGEFFSSEVQGVHFKYQTQTSGNNQDMFFDPSIDGAQR